MSATELPGVSVVVPVYCGAKTIDELVARLVSVLSKANIEHEILLVNDGSTDDSWSRIAALACSEKAVRGIDLVRNFGQHNAVLAGVRSARHATIVTIDDDLQHPPEEIPRLLAALTDDVDVVYGAARRNRQPVLRRAASALTRTTLQRLMGVEAARNVSAFRAFRTDVRRSFDDFSQSEFSLDVLLSWGTRRFTAVTVAHEARRHGRSNYSTFALFKHTVNMVVGFSSAPLRLASLLGFAAFAIGLVLLGYVLVNVLVNGTKVPGFAFLGASVSMFAGVQLFVLGVMGEYLAKVFQRTTGRPPYAIRTSTSDVSSAEG